jgi:Na+-transporting methylmalonyl-CoA/oxaloacetate decarboxylase gamma subunit
MRARSQSLIPIASPIMKNFLLLILALSLFATGGCSRSEDKTTVKPQSTPDAERLKSDSERLQQATANAAREREKANQSTPSPTASP